LTRISTPLQTGRFSVQEPGEWDVNELFESVQPRRVRVVPGELIDQSKLELGESSSPGFERYKCKEPVHIMSENNDYRRMAFCKCVAAIYAPPYVSPGPTNREWALLVH
jgi:hypothetical protein